MSARLAGKAALVTGAARAKLDGGLPAM